MIPLFRPDGLLGASFPGSSTAESVAVCCGCSHSLCSIPLLFVPSANANYREYDVNDREIQFCTQNLPPQDVGDPFCVQNSLSQLVVVPFGAQNSFLIHFSSDSARRIPFLTRFSSDSARRISRRIRFSPDSARRISRHIRFFTILHAEFHAKRM